MNGKMRLYAAALSCLLCVTGCSLSDGDLFFIVPTPDKTPPKSIGQMRTAVFVDSAGPYAEEILASTAGYVLKKMDAREYEDMFGNQDNDLRQLEGTPYFDYVVISGGYIKQGNIAAYVEYSPELIRIVEKWEKNIKPLHDRGIKVLLGICGGGDGVSFGSLAAASEQALFGEDCASFCRYYGLDGVDLYDTGGENADRSPYPGEGREYWDGETMISINTIADDPNAELLLADSWKKGGDRFADLLSYILVAFGAATSFQGDIGSATKEEHPILVREVGFGRYLPSAVPRFAFATTMMCMSFVVNDKIEDFGNMDPKDTQGIKDGVCIMDFVGTRDYAPAQIDLDAITDAKLTEFSEKLGYGEYYDSESNIVKQRPGRSNYGLVYYINPGLPSESQTEKLSVTSREVFGYEVEYTGR
ncbi:hypothetical protein AGMMS4952_24640 [Spirochaetia bacterium]|nr:hypothetical protein AGMMS4952_24640 [Spirochaetia bacterium]